MNNIRNSRAKRENQEKLSVILSLLLNIGYRFNYPNFRTIREQLFKEKLKAQSKTRCVIFISI